MASSPGSVSVMWCALAWSVLRHRLDVARADQRGMTTETVLITAGLALLAVSMVAFIGARVRSNATSIP